ncbi:MAG: hypothetical protein Q8T08_23270 [Ignavibacteria bacterium]|nr:hypothetical protein [Ignavibacteria bacterium]
MKIIGIIVLTLVVCCCNFKNDGTNQLEGQNLKGEIKSVHDLTYKAVEKFGEITKGEREDGGLNNTFSLYNKNGNREEFILYDEYDTIIQKYIYKYNDTDKLIEQIYILGKKTVSKTVCKYNDNDKSKESITYNVNGEILDKTISKYDNKENLIEIDYYNSQGDLNAKTKYKYDKRGNNIEYVAYNSDGNLNFRQLYKYDTKSNVIEEISYDLNGNITGTTFYEYDNSNFKILDKHILPDGKIDSHQTFKYDKNGYIIEWNWNSLALKVYKYEYDKKSNWVKQISYLNEMPESICERKIEYYK